jgi:serine/threonine protein phosphatase PrpC
MADLSLLLGKATDVGRRRDHNEDAMTTFQTASGWTVCVVADGMGGHLAGEVASARAIEVIEHELRPSSVDEAGALDALRTAIERANLAIWDEAQGDVEKAGMGTTVVAALLTPERAFLANAGDSPAFLVRDGTTQQVTNDHGVVAEQVRAGILTAEDAEYHPFRHVLTRCLGAEDRVDVEVYPPLDLQDGDMLVLCSDGLTEHVRMPEVAQYATEPDPDLAAQGLIDLANARGGHDNITVVVARVRADP